MKILPNFKYIYINANINNCIWLIILMWYTEGEYCGLGITYVLSWWAYIWMLKTHNDNDGNVWILLVIYFLCDCDKY